MPTTFVCEVCGTHKDKSPNGWFLLYLLNDQLVTSPWDERIASDTDMTHACGQGCTLALSERWLWQRNFQAFEFVAGRNIPVEELNQAVEQILSS
jgi:hypothetical protein